MAPHSIVNISSPNGRSINNGITSTLTYASIDNAVALVHTLGNWVLMAKLHLQDAYHLVPVHPSDRPLLSMHVEGWTLYGYNLTIRFAVDSKNLFSTRLIWLVHNQHFRLHYLDDILIMGLPSSTHCKHATLQLCKELEMQVAAEKTKGPSIILTFLGIEIDTHRCQLCLPQEKLGDLTHSLNGCCIAVQKVRKCLPTERGQKRPLFPP